MPYGILAITYCWLSPILKVVPMAVVPWRYPLQFAARIKHGSLRYTDLSSKRTKKTSKKNAKRTSSRIDKRHNGNESLSSDHQIIVWHEVCKTIRWITVTFGIVAGIGLVTWGVVAVQPAPWWKVLLFTAAPPLSVLGTVIMLLKKSVKKKIDELSKRNRTLEQVVDPTRESSGLLNDGTHPHDD